MTFEQFQAIFSELIDAFGERNYAPNQVSSVWDYVRDLTTAEFRIVVSSLLDNHTRAPTVAQIRDAARRFHFEAEARKRNNRVRTLQLVGKGCSYCKMTGVINAVRKAGARSDNSYAFKCTYCDVGNAMNKNYPQWSAQLSSEFEVKQHV